jgi:cytochrome c oxidase accessory protein FixG
VNTTSQLIATDAGSAGAASVADQVDGFAPVDLYQKREKIFTRSIEGRFQRIRALSGWPFLLGYLLLPWLMWHGRQAVLFDLPERKFYIFGLTFWPQDFMLLTGILIIAAFALFTLTSVVGRVWCGYTCPQTVWTAIFMWAEQFAEGPRHVRMKLDEAAWSFTKLRKRALKHGMWIGWALLTGATFVGYFMPIRELVSSALELHLGGWALFWTAFFTAATYFNAGWLREQVCIYMCPYARFQSAMFDKDTLIVSYDAKRGEPRGSRKRDADPAVLGLGDCIDCQLCVQVCPTGIDIRDGLQYQCIGCAHCIDACDSVMQKVGYAPGLIRYTTEHALGGAASRILRPRVVGYGTALALMLVLFGVVLVNRDLFSIDVLRERGALYQQVGDDIRNDYALKVINKTQHTQQLRLTVEGPGGVTVRFAQSPAIAIESGDVLNLPVDLLIARAQLPAALISVTFRLCSDADNRCIVQKSHFFGPAKGQS